MEHITAGRGAARAATLVSLIFGLYACYDDEDSGELNASSSGQLDAVVRGEGLPNSPPRIFGNPAFEAVAGTEYTFQPVASDPDGDRLGFSIRNAPVWASFDPGTGRLQGRPTENDVGSTGTISITVSDGRVGTDMPAFTILVTATPEGTAGGSPPTLTGTPRATTVINELYVFSPVAQDPDGDLLQFGIINQPAWLHFDTSNATLSGTPGSRDIGNYADILITVSDGTRTSSLGPFEIQVVGDGSKSITLTWTIPGENDDGTPLIDLAGYEIRYSSSPRTYSQLIRISDPATTSYTVSGLDTGTYYFVTSAYNALGITSDYSNEVNVDLN
jgi:hypothetical protein